MKSTKDIRAKLRQAIFRHRKRKIQSVLETVPGNCQHNQVILLSNGEEVGICRFAWPYDEYPGVCDEAHDGLSQAQECPHYTPRVSKDQVKDEFKEFFSTASLAEIARDYPDAAALMWVLGDEDIPSRDVEIPENEDWDKPRANNHSLQVQGVRVFVESDEDLDRLVDTFEAVDAAADHARMMVSVNECIGQGDPPPSEFKACTDPLSVAPKERTPFWELLCPGWFK